ncbi:hypothetical protein [Clostridium botulinum]|uniref:hypothetical protein n=1 Tax=Clostridium botulinum TaxID=1491 RepID=UPI0003764D50|nr:hypothetical protein [Clostridium botulinum]
MIMNNQNLGLRPRNKVRWHLFWAFTTAGIGNLMYYIAVKQKQKQWDSTVGALNTNHNNNHNYNH